MINGTEAGAAQFGKRFLRTMLAAIHQIAPYTRQPDGEVLPSLRQFELPAVIGYVCSA
jgi:hypothetical protein